MSSARGSGKREISRYKRKYVRRSKLVRTQMERENDEQLKQNKTESVSKDEILKQKISENCCIGSSYARQKLEAVKSEEKLIDENDNMQTLSADYVAVASDILAEKPVDHLEPMDELMDVEEVLTAMAEQESWKQFESGASAKSK